MKETDRMYETASPAKPESQMEERITVLGLNISDLEEVVLSLESRLRAVLMPEHEGPEPQDTSATPEPMLVPHADRLRSQTRTVSRLTGRLSDVLRRLEV